jgi:hypothetical protein
MQLFHLTNKFAILFFAVNTIAFSLNARAVEDDPFAPFLPKREPGEADPFAQNPVPKIEKEQPGKGPSPEIDPALDYLFRLGDGATPDERKHFRDLRPEALDRLRTHFLERLNTDIDGEMRAALSTVALMVRKLRQWDDAGVEYNRDEMIESMLKCIKTEDPRRIAKGMLSLRGLRDERVHSYIASFLNHEHGMVRRTAERILPTTEPAAASQNNSDKEKGIETGNEGNPPDRSDAVSNDGKMGTGLWIGIAAILALAALVCHLARGKKKR